MDSDVMDGDDDLVAQLQARRAEVEERRAGLLALQQRIVEASEGDNADDEHDPEGQTIAWDRAQTASLVQAAEEQLAEIDRALHRFEAGWDGMCEVCGQPIPPLRLAVRPTATRCVGCAATRAR